MLKRYADFINEGYEDGLDFHEAIVEASDEAVPGTNYSAMCKTDADPDEDYAKMQNELDKYGYTFERIRNHFKGESLVRYVDKHKLDSHNGIIDIYLYKTYEKLGIDPNKYDLGGPGWADNVREDSDELSEAVIRYSYGYHKTKYGILGIEQAGISIYDFIKMALKDILEIIDVEFYKIANGAENYLDIKEFIISEEDRLIIMTGDLSEEIEKHNNSISNEELQNSFINLLSKYHLDDYDITKDTLIVYGDFK